MLNKLLFIHCIEIHNKKSYIIDINILGYTTKTSNNKHLFKRIDKEPFVILQKK